MVNLSPTGWTGVEIPAPPVLSSSAVSRFTLRPPSGVEDATPPDAHQGGPRQGPRPRRPSPNSQHPGTTLYKSTEVHVLSATPARSTPLPPVRHVLWLSCRPRSSFLHGPPARHAINPDDRLVRPASGACELASPPAGPGPAAATAVINNSYTPSSTRIQKRPAQDVKKSRRIPAATTPQIRSGSRFARAKSGPSAVFKIVFPAQTPTTDMVTPRAATNTRTAATTWRSTVICR